MRGERDASVWGQCRIDASSSQGVLCMHTLRAVPTRMCMHTVRAAPTRTFLPRWVCCRNSALLPTPACRCGRSRRTRCTAAAKRRRRCRWGSGCFSFYSRRYRWGVLPRCTASARWAAACAAVAITAAPVLAPPCCACRSCWRMLWWRGPVRAPHHALAMMLFDPPSFACRPSLLPLPQLLADIVAEGPGS